MESGRFLKKWQCDHLESDRCCSVQACNRGHRKLCWFFFMLKKSIEPLIKVVKVLAIKKYNLFSCGDVLKVCLSFLHVCRLKPRLLHALTPHDVASQTKAGAWLCTSVTVRYGGSALAPHGPYPTPAYEHTHTRDDVSWTFSTTHTSWYGLVLCYVHFCSICKYELRCLFISCILIL